MNPREKLRIRLRVAASHRIRSLRQKTDKAKGAKIRLEFFVVKNSLYLFQSPTIVPYKMRIFACVKKGLQTQ